jgi:hypothetical protein
VPVTLHGILAYAITASLVVGLAIGNVPPLRRRFGFAWRWIAIATAALIFPMLTTGMLAHCQRIWAAADVEDAQPNLPWYRLTRDAAGVTAAWQSPMIAWHVWLGATVIAMVVMSWLGRHRLQRWLTSSRANIAGQFVGTVAFIVLVTGYTLARHTPHAASFALLPAIYMLFLGFCLFFAVVLVGLVLPADPKPRQITAMAIATSLLLGAALATNLWLTTAWQPARFSALLRQPRDLAQILSALSGIATIAALVRLGRARWRTCLAATLALLLAAHLWFTALILYDGSHRASPLWRFHRPFIQHPAE